MKKLRKRTIEVKIGTASFLPSWAYGVVMQDVTQLAFPDRVAMCNSTQMSVKLKRLSNAVLHKVLGQHTYRSPVPLLNSLYMYTNNYDSAQIYARKYLVFRKC